jgi:ABC-type transport system involved in cytochrome c biogenesis ATPase subunit
MFDVLRLLS